MHVSIHCTEHVYNMVFKAIYMINTTHITSVHALGVQRVTVKECDTDHDLYPNVQVLLQIACTIPVVMHDIYIAHMNASVV